MDGTLLDCWQLEQKISTGTSSTQSLDPSSGVDADAIS
jgi:hypothetical protein